jgi:hypothetical protein
MKPCRPVPSLRLTLPHRFDFGADSTLVGDDLRSPERWDQLRLETAGAFSIPDSAEALREAAHARPELAERARGIAALARGQRVASYGVGAAFLERCLLDEGVALEVTEYAPRTVAQLERVLPGAAVSRHDLAADPPLGADLHVLHRVETELDDAAWRKVFARFAGERVLVVPGGILEPRALPGTLVHLIRNRRATRAGWLRTRAALTALWEKTHVGRRVDLAGEAWLLEPRR